MSAQVELPGGSPPAPADTPVAPATPAGISSSSDEWTGELSSLDNEEWWKTTPEDLRGKIRPGIERRYKAWQGDYTKKTTTLADERKAWEADRKAHDDAKAMWETEREKDRQERESAWKEFYDVMLEGKTPEAYRDELFAERDARISALQAELDALKQGKQEGTITTPEFNVELDKLKQELTDAQTKFQSGQAELEKLRKEFEEKESEYKGQIDTLEEHRREMYAAQILGYIQANGPGIDSDSEALDATVNMIDDGIAKGVGVVLPTDPPEKRAKAEAEFADLLQRAVRVGKAIIADKNPQPQPQPSSPSEQAMSIGGPGNSKVRPPEKEKDWRELKREAEAARLKADGGLDPNIWG